MSPAPVTPQHQRNEPEDRTGLALAEQTFFDDPVLDRLMGMTVALAAEVYALRSRVIDLERIVGASASTALTPEDTGDATRAREDADHFVARLFQPLCGEQQSKGPVAR